MIEYKDNNGTLTCIFSGPHDTEESKKVEETMPEQIEGKSSVIFDLGDVDYISSAFLRICIKTVNGMGKEAFSIINAQPAVKRIFKISRMEAMMNID